MGLRGGSEVKNSAINAGDTGLIPGSERFPGEGNGNLLQYSCLIVQVNRFTNSHIRLKWKSRIHRFKKQLYRFFLKVAYCHCHSQKDKIILQSSKTLHLTPIHWAFLYSHGKANFFYCSSPERYLLLIILIYLLASLFSKRGYSSFH